MFEIAGGAMQHEAERRPPPGSDSAPATTAMPAGAGRFGKRLQTEEVRGRHGRHCSRHGRMPAMPPALPELAHDADLTPLNTLALPARARLLATLQSADAARAVAQHPALRKERRFILGGGSNLVLAADFDGLVLRSAIPGRRPSARMPTPGTQGGAGETWHDFVQWTLAQGWLGLENLALIPAPVGAAPIQNIGAYGLELGERFHALTAVDLADGRRAVDAAACCSAIATASSQQGWHLDGRLLITDVTFRLPKAGRR